MRPLFLSLAALVLAVPGLAQTCEPGTAKADLDVAGVRARLYNIGNLFWRGSGAVYEVPQGSGKVAMFSSGLWIGGVADGNLHFSGSTYGPWEFAPGPLDADGQTTPEACAAADRIWVVRTADVDAYDATGTAATDLAEWPVGIGAPFYTDANANGVQDAGEPTVALDPGDAGYNERALNLGAGERPVLFGRQTAWWVMNDLSTGDWGTADPLGIEVRVTAWAGTGDAELVYSTFYRYETINRSARTYEDTFVSLFADFDLGNFNDDYVFSDSTRSVFGVYNGDGYDDGASGYGDRPPALGVDLLSGGYGAMVFHGSFGVTSDPSRDGGQAYTFQQSLWKDGLPLRLGGDGYNTDGPPLRWAYPAAPPAFWSEYDREGDGTANTPADRRGVVSARVGTLPPGGRDTLDVAFIFGQGEDQFDSVVEVKRLSDFAQGLYDAGTLTVPADDPPAPTAAPTLVSPANGARILTGPLVLEWEPVPGATGYRVTIDTSATPFFEVPTFDTRIEIDPDSLPRETLQAIYWSVTPENLGTPGPSSERRWFQYYVDLNRIVAFEMVANGAGPIVPATGAAADFAGFPAPERWRDEAGAQQVTDGNSAPSPVFGSDAIWLVSTGGRSTFDQFNDRTWESRGNTSNLFPFDYEMRFTGSSLAAKDGIFSQTGPNVTVPFELWNIGMSTPDDPSDDIRLIPLILDIDDDGTYNLSTADSELSGALNDPETDWIYWYTPADASPGEAGYLAWETTEDTALLDREVLARTTLVAWDAGTAPPYPLPYPEAGTVIRIRTSTPRPIDAGPARSVEALSLSVRPNPVAGRAEVPYTLAADAEVRLSVVDVLGREVAVLAEGAHRAGAHRATFETAGLATGVYLVVLEAEDQRIARAVTVIR